MYRIYPRLVFIDKEFAKGLRKFGLSKLVRTFEVFSFDGKAFLDADVC